MKKRTFIYQLVLITVLGLVISSCFQDLGQNPPFDYPEEPPK